MSTSNKSASEREHRCAKHRGVHLFSDIDVTACLGCTMEEYFQLRGLLNAMTAERAWNDRPNEHDAEIAKAHPTVSKNYERYGRALEMVEDRNSKYALVDLVNWLLSRCEITLCAHVKGLPCGFCGQGKQR